MQAQFSLRTLSTCWEGSVDEVGGRVAEGGLGEADPGAGQEEVPGDRAEEAETPLTDLPAVEITWAPLSLRWRAACAGTSPSSCPARPGPTATSSG